MYYFDLILYYYSYIHHGNCIWWSVLSTRIRLTTPDRPAYSYKYNDINKSKIAYICIAIILS